MERVLNDSIIQELIESKLQTTTEYRRCSYISREGKILDIIEHRDVQKLLMAMNLADCSSFADWLLLDLGYLKYSWIGEITLPSRGVTKEQLCILPKILVNIKKYRDEIIIYTQDKPNINFTMPLDNIDDILVLIKQQGNRRK